MILLNRATLNHCSVYPENTFKNEKITQILNYINNNLAASLSIDTLSSRFFISRYHLMHSLKTPPDILSEAILQPNDYSTPVP